MFGLDVLAGVKYQDVLVKEWPEGWALGIFAETFGDARKTIKAILDTGRCPVVRVQLIWSDAHAFGDKDIPKVRELSRQYNKIAARYPRVKFYLSPFCEGNLKNPDKYLDIVKRNAPNCEPVNTVWNGALSKKYINEIHGNKKAVPSGRYFFSYDGQACVDANVAADKSKYSSADIFFFWDAQFNGKHEPEDSTPRPLRKDFPDSKLIDSVIWLKNQKGDCKLPAKWLAKSHAENKGTDDWRANKLLIISPIKAEEILLKASNGQVIETLGYYGTYEGGLYRYYSDQYGFELSQKAIRIQGINRPVVDVVINGKIYGQINPAFREGSYR